MSLVRKNYDKPNRCPGWSGSGILEYPWETKQNSKVTCEGASSGYYNDHSVSGVYANFNFHKCTECGTVTLPIVLEYIDPEYWYSIYVARFVRQIKRRVKKIRNK